ncbi:MAG: LPS export ABC transporter periplasmic protein LptC, partial [Acidobacteriota bacterium]|nr:LPS export ABC transporter periplasmic protein LptC [Acidobacteriota bacterium]
MIWQKWLRAALAVVLVALVAGVGWYVSRDRPVSEAAVEPTRTDPTAQTEIAGDEFTRTEDGKVLFRMKYERGYSYADGRVRLVKINGTFTRNAGAPMDVTADEADLVLKSGAGLDLAKFDEMHMRGHVVFKAGDELHMATEEAHYNDLTGIMETDKAATVTRGKMSGSGTGVTFDRERSVIWLLADAKVKMQLDGQGTLDVTSGRAGLADLEKYMRFEENVRMERDGRVIETDAAVANMTPEGNGITGLELRGHSRITGAGSGGGVPNMRADDITITYGADTGLLERAVLDRAARLDLPEG